MNELTFRLDISREDYLLHYQGAASQVVARSLDGLTIQFPAAHLRQFITHTGIHGLFAIRFDEQNKFQSIAQVA